MGDEHEHDDGSSVKKFIENNKLNSKIKDQLEITIKYISDSNKYGYIKDNARGFPCASELKIPAILINEEDCIAENCSNGEVFSPSNSILYSFSDQFFGSKSQTHGRTKFSEKISLS